MGSPLSRQLTHRFFRYLAITSQSDPRVKTLPSTPGQHDMARELAQKWKKPVTAGSDAHVPEEVGGGVTVLEADELSLSAVKAALLRGAKQVEGRRGRAMCVARSQKTKREKTNAGVKRRVNGMLFTVKCALQDFTTREDGWHVMDR